MNPVDGNQCIVGGLECYKTTDGGATWTKIAVWVGGPGQQYIHADQHDVQWWDGGTKLMFACDGGIFYSADGGTTIRDRNKGLRIKQFYSVAIHPTETNNIIAGAQDNGMHRLNHPGLDSSIEFYGGDGMFCAIDQNEPQYQFGSAFNNNIRRSLNGGNTWGNVAFAGGRFVSPWDYDNAANKIYLCNGSGNFIRWDDPQTGTASTSIAITDFGGMQVSAVHVSPFTANRVYFGTSNGTTSRLVIADNANTATPTTSIITPPGASGFLNCIVTGSSDQHLMACFSNFGVTNVFVTADGGITWTACDGNLPDMPVRWGLFHPDTDTKAYIATATGVWETDLLNGASTVWSANASFPNVSTDMIKYRASDRLIAAATHGRGIWTTNIPGACATASVLSVSGLSTICNGGSANLVVTVTGGQSPFTVVYNDGTSNFTVNNYLSGANIPVSPTVNTTYSLVSVTDANLCAGSGNSGTPLITVNPVPTVNAVANQSYCNNASVPSVVFTSPVPGATFSWTRTAEAIGLGTTSGSGNVPAFTGTNAGAAPLTATFTVTASYTNNGVTCTGAPTQFTITIAAPITATATPSSQSVCTGTAITTIVMSGSEPTAVYNWTRDNTVSVTGIAASGSGNISGTMTNSTGAPITVTFTITPVANGCPGTPITATVVVSPIPVITISPTSANICPNTIVPISVTGGSPPTAQSLVTASGTISLSIPDNLPAGLTSNLTVPALPPGAVINSVDVKLNVTHTWDADLIINLKAPNGEVLNLVNGRGGSGDNFTNTVISSASAVSLGTSSAPFTGTFAADANALNPATGYTPTTTSFPALFGTGNGTWTLALRDNASADFGTLVDWSITINFTAAPPPPVWTPVTGLYSDAGATIPYAQEHRH
ncbi:MAG: proprotein convertase P-domain-containing protein [Chitinophagaceae bacterium]|nr:proprotein convertase P-domain-containing protein [Chitinophagaceae bacterium]